jgi:ABC-2 type transport system permease protein
MSESPHPFLAQLRIAMGLTRYTLRATTRNQVGYFFSFVFPLVFVIAFGLIGNSRLSIRLGIDPALDASSEVMRALEQQTASPETPIDLVREPRAELERQLSRGRIAAILAPPQEQGASITVVGSNGNPVGRAAAEAYLRGLLSDMSLRAAGIQQPAYRLQSQEIAGKGFRHIDFILPGQIGFAMLSLATFGVGYTLAMLRKILVLKRMLATTAEPITIVVAQCLSRSVQGVIQTAVLIAVGVVLFKFTLARGWITYLDMLLLSFFGLLAFLGFGILICNLAKDEQTLPVALNLFNLPQVILAGVFFPIDGMPRWVQVIGNNLPLAYLNTSLRRVATDGATLLDVWPYMAGMLAWAVVAYVLAARTFRTE